MSHSKNPDAVIPRSILVPFILVTSLFALWGFANDITNPMVAGFKNILLISNFESSLVQFAFYGYCVMAIPAALFIQKFSYKKGLLMGLFLYALGCLLFIPSGWMMEFWAFLLSYFIMTCGLSFLETSANPYILALGPEVTATRRLNFAQAFNPLGSITGMFVASNLILAKLNTATEGERIEIQKNTPDAFTAIQKADLGVIIGPYAIAGNELGIDKATAQRYNIAAMTIFVSSRFICTYLLKYVSPGGLLGTLAVGGFLLTLGAIFIHGMTGLYCMIGISACTSLMFPTIYGI